jgi:hypothetical protein
MKEVPHLKLDDTFPWGQFKGKLVREVIDKNYYYFNMNTSRGWITVGKDVEDYVKESDGYKKATQKRMKWERFLDSQD